MCGAGLSVFPAVLLSICPSCQLTLVTLQHTLMLAPLLYTVMACIVAYEHMQVRIANMRPNVMYGYIRAFSAIIMHLVFYP